MQSKPIVVIKFGTASITDAKGNINDLVIEQIAQQVAVLQKDFSVVLVSSGAVGAGKNYIKKYKGKLVERKAAAAIGNPILISLYAKYFMKFGIPIAQSLCERHHFSNRNQFLQLKDTYQELWKNGIIPIANENDVVSNLELKFSDNDELATLIAVGFEAKYLLLCTSVGGLLDANKNIIPKIEQVNHEVLNLADTSKSAVGLGGMVSKLTFTKLATDMGIKVVIFGMNKNEGILGAINEQNGTVFFPKQAKLNARKKWLGSGSLIQGKIILDAGAAKAIEKGKSLLAVGVKKVIGNFTADEIVQLMDENDGQIAVARTSFGAEEINQNLKTNNFEIAHADNIVVA